MGDAQETLARAARTRIHSSDCGLLHGSGFVIDCMVAGLVVVVVVAEQVESALNGRRSMCIIATYTRLVVVGTVCFARLLSLSVVDFKFYCP